MLSPEQNKALDELAAMFVGSGDSINARTITDAFKQKIINQTLIKTRGNQAGAARFLEMDRTSLRNQLKNMGYRTKAYKHGN
ncbi:hypothetical protein NTE19_003388 [Vibrio fluvialis]|nr:hypothetical protein [Vibrio fluvialis]